MTINRRKFLQTAAAGTALLGPAALSLWPTTAWADTPVEGAAPGLQATTLEAALWETLQLRQFPAASPEITVQVADTVTDPLTVPITVRAQHPMQSDNYIAAIYLFVAENPQPLASIFHCSPLSGAAAFSERIKLYKDSTTIRAVAVDNRHQVLASAPATVRVVGPLLP